jgi:hypothetical protein
VNKSVTTNEEEKLTTVISIPISSKQQTQCRNCQTLYVIEQQVPSAGTV